MAEIKTKQKVFGLKGKEYEGVEEECCCEECDVCKSKEQ